MLFEVPLLSIGLLCLYKLTHDYMLNRLIENAGDSAADNPHPPKVEP